MIKITLKNNNTIEVGNEKEAYRFLKELKNNDFLEIEYLNELEEKGFSYKELLLQMDTSYIINHGYLKEQCHFRLEGL